MACRTFQSGRLAWTGAVALALGGLGVAGAQQPAAQVDFASHLSAPPAALIEPATDTGVQFLPAVGPEVAPPTTAEPVAEPVVAAPAGLYPIDLPLALALAEGESLHLALARELVREAAARQRAAEVLWLPSLRVGLNYNKHEGVIQDVIGTAFPTSRGAFWVGGGAGAVGAASPAYPGVAMNFHLTDAWFQPLAARQVTRARQFATAAARNDARLEVALGYVELERTVAHRALSEEIVARTAQVADWTEAYARTGAGLRADADRLQTELVGRRNDIWRAEEAYRATSARLAQLLRLDPLVVLAPSEERLGPLEFVPADAPLDGLVAQALGSRPELAELRALVGAAGERYRREAYAPFVPQVAVGLSGGGFGAGRGGTIAGFDGRFDFDAVAWWEVRNLGAGEHAARDVACSQVRQAEIRLRQTYDLVAREVVESAARAEARRQQVATTAEAVARAEDSLQRNLARIAAGEGLPIEALQSLQAWAQARREVIQALADYNAAQLALFRALGWPVAR